MNLPTIFGTETVDSILSTFEAQREKLKALSLKLQDAAKREQEQAEALRLAAETKAEEAARATRVAQRIAELVG